MSPQTIIIIPLQSSPVVRTRRLQYPFVITLSTRVLSKWVRKSRLVQSQMTRMTATSCIANLCPVWRIDLQGPLDLTLMICGNFVYSDWVLSRVGAPTIHDIRLKKHHVGLKSIFIGMVSCSFWFEYLKTTTVFRALKILDSMLQAAIEQIPCDSYGRGDMSWSRLTFDACSMTVEIVDQKIFPDWKIWTQNFKI